MREPAVRLVPLSADDLSLLRRINTPQMRQHVGGPETDEQVVARHQRYLALEGGRMFRIELTGGEAAGSVAFWSRLWHGVPVYESGWNVLPEFQGRGVATAAVRAVLAAAGADGRHRWLHAFPSVANAGSNAVCSKTGFVLVGESILSTRPGGSSAATIGATTWAGADFYASNAAVAACGARSRRGPCATQCHPFGPADAGS